MSVIRIKVPGSLCQPVAEKAVRYSRFYANRRGWSTPTVNSLTAISDDGMVGITSNVKHLFYQERGTKAFLMKSLEGRRVPIDGRILTVKDVGKPGFVHIPREGLPDKVVWRDQKWRHPGIKPTNFMKESLSRAILEDTPSVRKEVLRRLRGD